MKKTLFTVVLFTFVLAGTASAQTDGWMSRYWDGCKAHCMWSGNVGGAGNAAKSCNKQNQEIPVNDGVSDGCHGGDGYYCWNHAPVAISNTEAWGFVARRGNSYSGKCGECYEISFTGSGQHGHSNSLSGKKMIVKLSNVGYDVEENQFDLLVPGGGVGLFNAFSGQLNIDAKDLGAQHGGFVTTCGHGNTACVVEKCNTVFAGPGREDLKDGCLFYANWLGAANNPQVKWKTVSCPAGLDAWYKPGGARPTGISNPGQPTSYTVTYNINGGTGTAPQQQTVNAGGNVTLATGSGFTRANYTFAGWNTNEAGTGTNYSAGASFTPQASTTLYAKWTAVAPTTVTITYNLNDGSGTVPPTQTVNSGTPVTVASGSGIVRTGYTFAGWNTNANGSGTNYAAGVSFTPTQNVVLYAKWTAIYTVTYNANGGTGTVPAAQTVNAGSSITIANGSGLVLSGYTFSGWNSNTSGTGTNYSVGASFSPTNNTTMYARWVAVGATTYTLTVNAGTGGTVNPSGQQTVPAQTDFSILAVPNEGYTFTNWTVATGSVQINNANSSSTTVSLTSNATVTANFQRQSQGGGDRTDTIKVEAETLTEHIPNCDPNNNNPMCIGTNNAGVKNIGWINSGDNATYTVPVTNAGAYTLEIMLASEQDISFSITVNGSNVGSVTRGGTGGWDTYQMQKFSTDVNLTQGTNTIVFRFDRAVNVDYFLLLGEPVSSIKHVIAGSKNTRGAGVTLLKGGARGLSAVLPPNHSYTSYKLIDARGREVRSGQVGPGVTSIRFDNLKNSVLFLRLEGKNGMSTVVRAVTY